MAKLTIEEVIGVADEVIPMWRSKSRIEKNVYAKYLVYNKCYDIRTCTLVELAKLLGTSHDMILYYVRNCQPTSFDDIKKTWEEAIYIAENEVRELVGDDCINSLAEGLMQFLCAKECRIDYVDGKIRVRYVEQAED